MTYHIKLIRTHGFDQYYVELRKNNVKVASSQHWSKEYATTWAYSTFIKLRGEL